MNYIYIYIISMVAIISVLTALLIPEAISKVEAKEVVQERIYTPKMPEDKQIINYIKKVFKNQSHTALKIVRCESNFNPKAFNNDDGMIGYHAYGLFQIHNKFGEEDERKGKTNWKDNIDFAKSIYDKMGWKAGSCNKLI